MQWLLDKKREGIRNMKTLLAATLVAASTMTFAASAYAVDFPATPMNHGAPTNLPGETIIPGMTQAMQLVNGVTQPILQPILAPNPPAPAPMMEQPMRRHRMMRHSMHHKMMKKKMQQGM